MRPWIDWLAVAGLAAACMMTVGCGGGDVPDPGSDAAASGDAAPPGDQPPPAESEPAPATVSAPRPAAPSGPAATPKKEEGAKAEEQPAAAAAASESTPAGSDAAPAKGEAGSTTAEMLNLAMANQAAPPSTASTTTGGPGGSQGGPGGSPGAPGIPPGAGRSGGPMASSYPGAGGSGGPMASSYPGAGGSGGPMASSYPGAGGSRPGGPGPAGGSGGPMASSYPGAGGSGGRSGGPGQAGGGPAGYPGGPGGPMGGGMGGGEQDNGPTSTESPEGAVRAFLKAVKAKDRDGLMEATALRAAQSTPIETVSAKNMEFFGKILDGSISDTELDDLAKKFEGFRIAGVNAVKSTGKLGIYIDKTTDDGDTHRRTITVRKEKKGWGVMDISGETLFKGMSGRRRGPNR